MLKNRNRIGFLMLFASILILNITNYINFSAAWSNGKSGDGCSAYANDPLLYNYDCHFGTHDWIAKASLDTLLLKNSSQWRWLNDRIFIYLLGTEAPDNSDIDIMLNNVRVEGFGDNANHHIFFNDNGSALEDDSALRAEWCGNWADVYISEEKLDAAAFYMGAMTHYISDMAVFAHVAENNVDPHFINFDEHHSAFEGYILTRSDDYADMQEFFQIQTYSINKIKPYDAALNLAWNTFKDQNATESTIRDAIWLHDNFFTGWELTHSQRTQDTPMHQLFYDRIEESINIAVKLTGEALNYIAGTDYEVAEEKNFLDIFIGYILPISGVVIIVGIVIFIVKSRI